MSWHGYDDPQIVVIQTVGQRGDAAGTLVNVDVRRYLSPAAAKACETIEVGRGRIVTIWSETEYRAMLRNEALS